MLTQDEYRLLTGQTVCFPDEEWDFLVDIAKNRLASLLCLEDFPELDDNNKDLVLLLANFLCATLKFQGAPDTIGSKSVRNFTINFKSSATNAFEQIYHQYRDIIEKYDKCDFGIKVECSARHCCEYNNGFLNF